MNDENERLRAVLAKDRRDIHTQRAVIGDLQAEIEKLRHALQRIKVENADIHCEEIARVALENDDE